MISYLTIILALALGGVFGWNDLFLAILVIGIVAWLIEVAASTPPKS